MKKILKYWYLPLIVLVMIFVYVINNSSNNDNVYASNNVEAKEEKDEDKNVLVSKYYVDIKGEVKNPGIYEVNSGTRINDVIKLSGGLTKNADVSIINLSKKVTDEMVIKIYSKKEVSDAKNSISNFQIFLNQVIIRLNQLSISGSGIVSLIVKPHHSSTG